MDMILICKQLECGAEEWNRQLRSCWKMCWRHWCNQYRVVSRQHNMLHGLNCYRVMLAYVVVKVLFKTKYDNTVIMIDGTLDFKFKGVFLLFSGVSSFKRNRPQGFETWKPSFGRSWQFKNYWLWNGYSVQKQRQGDLEFLNSRPTASDTQHYCVIRDLWYTGNKRAW